MTGIERIRDRILKDANAEAAEYVKKAKKEADEILKSAREEADIKRKTILEQAQKKAGDLEKRCIALNDMEVRKEIMRVKQELVQKTFNMAMERLSSMPREQYCEFMANMIVNAIQGEKAEIVLSKKDRQSLGEILLERVTALTEEKGAQVGLVLSYKTADIKGGFILIIGDMEINFSFEALFRTQKENLEELVYSLLGVR